MDEGCNGISDLSSSTIASSKHNKSDSSLTENALIQDLVTSNSKLTSQIETQSEKIKYLEAKLKEADKVNAQLLNEQQTLSKKTRRPGINKTISMSLRLLYTELETNEKFKTDEPFASNHNQSVKQKLIRLIKENNSSSIYSELNYTTAIKGRYDHEKKMNKENSPSCYARRKIAARRQAAFLSRKNISMRKNILKDFMSTLTAYDMSDLESDEDGNLVVKKPTWRTSEVDDSLKQIDSFASLKLIRSTGSPSKRLAKS